MSCVLRAGGNEFDPELFLSDSTLVACSTRRRGEPIRPSSPKLAKAGGVTIDVSHAGFDEFEEQITDAIVFLKENREEIRRLVEFAGVESAGLDFGVAWQDVAAQCDRLPATLVRLAGQLGLDLEISHYPISNNASTSDSDEGC